MSEIEWLQYQYIEDTQRDAWKYLTGLIESGAETPYIEAATLIETLLEGPIVESSAGAFVAAAMTAFTVF